MFSESPTLPRNRKGQTWLAPNALRRPVAQTEVVHTSLQGRAAGCTVHRRCEHISQPTWEMTPGVTLPAPKQEVTRFQKLV